MAVEWKCPLSDAQDALIEAMQHVNEQRKETGMDPDHNLILDIVLNKRGIVNVGRAKEMGQTNKPAWQMPKRAARPTRPPGKPQPLGKPLRFLVLDKDSGDEDGDTPTRTTGPSKVQTRHPFFDLPRIPKKPTEKRKRPAKVVSSDSESSSNTPTRKKRRSGCSKRRARSDSDSSASTDTDNVNEPPSPKQRARILDEEPEPRDKPMVYRPEVGRYQTARDVVKNLNRGLKRELHLFDFTDAKIMRSLDKKQGKIVDEMYLVNGKWKKPKEQRLLTVDLSAAEFGEVMVRAARTVGKEFAPAGDQRRKGRKVAKKLQSHLDKLAETLTSKCRLYAPGGYSPAKLLAAKRIYDKLFTILFDDIHEQRLRGGTGDEYEVADISKWKNSRWLEEISYAHDDIEAVTAPAPKPSMSSLYGQGRGGTHQPSFHSERQRRPKERGVNKRCNICGDSSCAGRTSGETCQTGGPYLKKHLQNGQWVPEERGIHICWAYNSNGGCYRRTGDCQYEH